MSIWKKIAIGFGALIAVSLAVSPFLPDEEETSTETEASAEAPAEPQEAPEVAPVAAPIPAPTEAPTATPAPTAVPLSDTEIAILAFRLTTNDLETGSSDNLSDDEIIDFTGHICDLAALVDSRTQFILLAVEINEGTGMSDSDAGAVMGAAIGAFCPDEGDRLGIG